MRILLINKFGEITGGADRHCLSLLQLLRARGHDARLLSTGPRQGAGWVVKRSVANAVRGQLSLGQRACVFTTATWNAEVWRLQRSVGRWQPDIVHCHKLYPQLSVAAVVAARRTGAPIFQTVHDYEFISASHRDHRGRRFDYDESTASFRALNSWLFALKRLLHVRCVDEWISVSRFVHDRYHAHGIASTVLLHFVEPAENPPLGFEGRSGVLFAGRLAEEKGVDDAIAVARQLPGIPFRIAGDGALAGAVREAAETQENVTYLGGLTPSALAVEQARALVVLVPSRWEEPAGLVALEAFVRGTPVVASDRGGLAEYVRLAKAGEVASDPRGLVRALQSMVSDRARWEKYSWAAVRACETIYAPGRYVDALEDRYKAALEAGSNA